MEILRDLLMALSHEQHRILKRAVEYNQKYNQIRKALF